MHWYGTKIMHYILVMVSKQWQVTANAISMWSLQCKWNNNKQVCVMSASQLWHESCFHSFQLSQFKWIWSLQGETCEKSTCILEKRGKRLRKGTQTLQSYFFWLKSSTGHDVVITPRQRICLSTNCKQQTITKGTLSPQCRKVVQFRLGAGLARVTSVS